MGLERNAVLRAAPAHTAHYERRRPEETILHHLVREQLKQAGLRRATADTGAVTLIQRFGSAANLKVQPQYPRYASD